MPIYRAQVIASADSDFPRDRLVNTLYFNDHGLGSDPTGLANDLASVFTTNWHTSPAGRRVNVRFYDLGDAEPREPKANVTVGSSSPASSIPREVALCLSFYAGRNLPRSRGRIYLPMCTTATALSLRPTPAHRNNALNIAQGCADLGGVDVDWIVHSTVGDASQPVSDAWCDDEYDTVRKRGLRATTRDTLHTGS